MRSIVVPLLFLGDVTWYIPLNCGATQGLDFTIRYTKRYFTPQLQ